MPGRTSNLQNSELMSIVFSHYICGHLLCSNRKRIQRSFLNVSQITSSSAQNHLKSSRLSQSPHNGQRGPCDLSPTISPLSSSLTLSPSLIHPASDILYLLLFLPGFLFPGAVCCSPPHSFRSLLKCHLICGTFHHQAVEHSSVPRPDNLIPLPCFIFYC